MPTPLAAPELKFTALDLKAVDADGTFSGYASLFNVEDMGRDIVLPGAFRDSLAARGPTGIKMLFQHRPDEPIGVWEQLKEDARGLYAKGRLMLDVARARETLSLMRAGALDGLSIGFRAVVGHRDNKSGVRRLGKVDLWEISIAHLPAAPRRARRPCQGAAIRGPQADRERIGTLAHAGSWAVALPCPCGSPPRVQRPHAGRSSRPNAETPPHRANRGGDASPAQRVGWVDPGEGRGMTQHLAASERQILGLRFASPNPQRRALATRLAPAPPDRAAAQP